jgi:hypothetical protein
LDCESAALTDAAAFGKYTAAMLFYDRTDNKESEPGTFYARHDTARDSIEPFEYAF